MINSSRLFFTSFLLIFISSPLFADAKVIAAKVETYEQLVSAIRQVRAESAQRVKQEKVRLAWETGKLIDEHVLQHKERADYGKHVIIRLAKDLGTSETELKYMLQFARSYPIRPNSDKLKWSDYRELLSLNDPKEREQLAERAQKEKWDINRIRQEIKRINAAKRGEPLPSQTLHAEPGKVGVYRVIRAKIGPYAGELALDLGFSNYYQPAELKEFKEGDIVFAEKTKEGYSLSGLAASFDDLYTYRAYVFNVIDGDTFTAIIDLGFEFVTEQKLRLRGLDAPEMDSPEGQKAKEFLELSLRGGQRPAKKLWRASRLGRRWRPKQSKSEIVSPTAFARNDKRSVVLIKTTKSDKYDRYLADVFVDGKYLNQELLNEGLAEIVL